MHRPALHSSPRPPRPCAASASPTRGAVRHAAAQAALLQLILRYCCSYCRTLCQHALLLHHRALVQVFRFKALIAAEERIKDVKGGQLGCLSPRALAARQSRQHDARRDT